MSPLDMPCPWCEAPAGKPCDYYACKTARWIKQQQRFNWPDLLAANLRDAGIAERAFALGRYPVEAWSRVDGTPGVTCVEWHPGHALNRTDGGEG